MAGVEAEGKDEDRWNQKFSRLRDWNCIRKPQLSISPLSRWNQKFLDYEIETIIKFTHVHARDTLVEIKSFSITRLKLHLQNAVCMAVRVGWNQKFLDYEIETSA